MARITSRDNKRFASHGFCRIPPERHYALSGTTGTSRHRHVGRDFFTESCSASSLGKLSAGIGDPCDRAGSDNRDCGPEPLRCPSRDTRRWTLRPVTHRRVPEPRGLGGRATHSDTAPVQTGPVCGRRPGPPQGRSACAHSTASRRKLSTEADRHRTGRAQPARWSTISTCSAAASHWQTRLDATVRVVATRTRRRPGPSGRGITAATQSGSTHHVGADTNVLSIDSDSVMQLESRDSWLQPHWQAQVAVTVFQQHLPSRSS